MAAEPEILTVDLTKPGANPTLLALDFEWARLRVEDRYEEAQAVLDEMHRRAAEGNRGLQ